MFIAEAVHDLKFTIFSSKVIISGISVYEVSKALQFLVTINNPPKAHSYTVKCVTFVVQARLQSSKVVLSHIKFET